MELTEFELGLKAIIETYFLDDNHTDEKLFQAIRKIMPPTCSKNERAFLDEIREKGDMAGFDFYPNRWIKMRGSENTVIHQIDFTKTNLFELVEGKG